MTDTKDAPSPKLFAEIRKNSKRPTGGRLQSYKCFCCGSGTNLANHHITPRAEGGSDEPRNKVTLCNRCHDAVEDEPWPVIVARRNEIREQRWTKRHPDSPAEDWLGGKTPLEKLKSIRGFCFERGVTNNHYGQSEDFRHSFRVVNRLYNELKFATDTRTPPIIRSLSPVARFMHQRLTPDQETQRSKIDHLLWHGTQDEWVKAIRDYANLPDAGEVHS